MRRFFAYGLIAWLLLCACGRKEEVRQYISLDFAAQATKASLPFAEDSVKTLDLLVFRQSDGQVEYVRHAEGNTVRAKLPVGIPLTWYLFANLPDDFFGEELTCVDDLAQYNCRLQDAFSRCFAMMGSGEGSFDVSGTGTVSVEIAHLSTKVVLTGLSAAFLQNGLAQLKLTLDKVYLTNVALDEPVIPDEAQIYEPESWGNCMGLDPDLDPVLRPFLLEEPGMRIESAAKVDLPIALFCAPNRYDTRDGDDGVHVGNTPEWSPRNTRLVLEMTINGIKNYYPITLPALKAGVCYRIQNLKLLGYGSEHPDSPVGRTRVAFSLSINEWGYEPEQEVEFEAE